MAKQVTKLPFNEWYKTVPKDKADTSNYRLRYAYENDLIPQEQLDAFVKDKNAHLMSSYLNPKTGNYDFIKSRNHPTHKLELDWYNGKTKDAIAFRRKYDYVKDESGFDSYVPKKSSNNIKVEPLKNDNTYTRPKNLTPERKVNTTSEFLFQGPKKTVDFSTGKPVVKTTGEFTYKYNPNANPGLIIESPEFDLLSLGGGFKANKAISSTLRKSSGAIDDGLTNTFGSDFIKRYKNYTENIRVSKLPESISEESFDALGSMRVRLKSSEGIKRANDLGIDANKLTRDLRDVKFVEDPRYYGYHEPNQNVISIHKNLLNKGEATRHELGHLEQNSLIDFDARGGKTDIDNMLSQLELRRNADPKAPNTYMSLNEKDIDVSDYAEKMTDQRSATNYFSNGSDGREKHPFLGELQQYMMKKNIIPSESYVEVTPEMIRDIHSSGLFDKKAGGEFIRLLRIIKPTDKNYSIISKAMNKMIVGSGVAAGVKDANSNNK